MIDEKDFFDSRQNYMGISVAVSKNAAASFSKVKYIIDCLTMIQRIFQNFRISIPLSDLLNHVVIVSGQEDRNWIHKKYEGSGDIGPWAAFYIRGLKLITVDTSAFKKKKNVLKTFVHEIGHAIYNDYIVSAPEEDVDDIASSRSYWKNISAQFTGLIEMADDWAIEEEEFDEAFFDMLDMCPFKLGNELQDAYTNALKFADPKRAGQYVLNKHMPTEYAGTNDNEDFAETFAMFILDNDNLSQHHKNRIINTLTKSRVQGKTVMNAHKDLMLIKSYVSLTLS